MREIAADPFPSSLQGAWILVGRNLVPQMEAWPRTVEAALALVGAGRTQTYEVCGRLWEAVSTVMGKPGRPANPPLQTDAFTEVCRAVRDYLLDHPGATCGRGERRRYSDGFRRFVVALTAPGQPGEGLTCAELAEGAGLPLGTLKGWLCLHHAGSEAGPAGRADEAAQAEAVEPFSVEASSAEPGVAEEPAGSPAAGHGADPDLPAEPSALFPAGGPEGLTAAAGQGSTQAGLEEPGAEPAGPEPAALDGSPSATLRDAHLALIATLWRSWSGTFRAFCQTVRDEHRLPYGDTYIGHVLQALGLRQRRPRIPGEAPWSRGTFQTLFPGAQWLGDGTTLPVRWNGQLFIFNVEVLLDVASNATVGFHVSDSEDEEALRQAYRMGVATAGSPPLATTLDNKPCNHSPGAEAALEGTILLAATPGRGQAKAALEGAFGLFQQSLPPLAVVGKTAREQARNALHLILTAWFRGRNGRPRKQLGGLTPAQAYARADPTPEEFQRALKWIRELQRQQKMARLTREARRDPVRIQLLTQGLAELGFPDPDQRLAVTLARYSREAIVHGLAIFRAKREQGTLPPGAGHRYLGGIIRQEDARLELVLTSVYLLEQRLRLRDLTLEPLEQIAAQLSAEVPASALPQAFIDHALEAAFAVDFRFWARAAAEALSTLPASQRAPLYQPLCRRIAASFKVDRERRVDLVCRLAEAMAIAA
jgi:transposase InsO family protein